MCLALWASGLWLCYAAMQNLIPHALHPGAIQGKEGIKFCHLATLKPSTPKEIFLAGFSNEFSLVRNRADEQELQVIILRSREVLFCHNVLPHVQPRGLRGELAPGNPQMGKNHIT